MWHKHATVGQHISSDAAARQDGKLSPRTGAALAKAEVRIRISESLI